MQIGTTFDPDYARLLGLNWQKTLKNIVKSGISHIRIGIKWNMVETEQDKFFWDDYDTIFKIISSANISTILAIGMKSPRWPEFYVPQWVNIRNLRNNTITLRLASHKLKARSGQANYQTDLKEHLFEFITKAIQRYGNLATLRYIQVENEPLMRFGDPNLKISYNFLKDEVAFVHQHKPKHVQVLLTTSGLPTSGLVSEYLRGGHKDKAKLLNLADTIGLNVFPRFEDKIFGLISHTFNASNSEWNYLKKWKDKIEKIGKECIATELQAEPWEKGNINYNDPRGNKTCNPDMVKQYLQNLKSMGFEKILLWGSEFHWKCKTCGNDKWVNSIYERF